MVRKVLGKNSPGTSSMFGADDIDYINLLLTGSDQTATDPVDINTQWTYRSSKLRIAHPSYSPPSTNAYFYTIVASAIAGNRNITLPLLTADDTIVTQAHPQPLSNKAINATTSTLTAVTVSPDIRVIGFTAGSATGTGYNAFAGNVSQTGGSVTSSATEGKYVRYTSGTTTGNDAGIRVSNANAALIRGKNAHFKSKFRFAPIGTATNARLFIGFTTNTAFMTGDDCLNNISGIGVYVTSVGSSPTFRLAHNVVSGGATVIDNIGGGTSVDTNIHTIEIQADQANTKFKYSWDGGGYVDVNSAIPGQDDLLCAQTWTETNDSGNGKTIDSWYMIGDQDP